MKFTLSWLKEHLETEALPSMDILYALTDLGLEVEGVGEPRATSLRAFKLVKVKEAEKPPRRRQVAGSVRSRPTRA